MSEVDLSQTGSPPQPALSLQSREVSAVLVERVSGEANDLFLSAHAVLTQTAVASRERMCGFALRELLDELEARAGVVRKGPSLGVRVNDLREAWDRADRSKDGIIVDPLFSQAIDSFFDAHAQDFPLRRQRAEKTIRGLDPAGPVEAPAVRAKQVEALQKLRDDLNKALHQGGDPSTVRDLLCQLEAFLLGWLRPQPFNDAAEIDEYLRGGPPRD
jgi:hypothetical protein